MSQPLKVNFFNNILPENEYIKEKMLFYIIHAIAHKSFRFLF